VSFCIGFPPGFYERRRLSKTVEQTECFTDFTHNKESLLDVPLVDSERDILERVLHERAIRHLTSAVAVLYNDDR